MEKKSMISVGDWVTVKAGELRGASGHVRTLVDGVATLRQLNGNELRVPVTRLGFSAYSHEAPEGLQ